MKKPPREYIVNVADLRVGMVAKEFPLWGPIVGVHLRSGDTWHISFKDSRVSIERSGSAYLTILEDRENEKREQPMGHFDTDKIFRKSGTLTIEVYVQNFDAHDLEALTDKINELASSKVIGWKEDEPIPDMPRGI